MPSRPAHVPGTTGVIETPVGPFRVIHSAAKPVCPECNENDRVMRLWHGGRKFWICDRCYSVTSTKKKEATLVERLMHKLPEPDTVPVSGLLVNRAARRRRK